MKKITFSLALSILLFGACNKSNTQNLDSSATNGVLNYIKAFRTNTDAAFSIGSNTNFFSFNHPKLELQGSFRDIKNNKTIPGGVLKINGKDMISTQDGNFCNPSNNKIDNTLQGKFVKFSFSSPWRIESSISSNGTNEVEMYIPREITLISPEYDNVIKNNIIKTGTVFKWEKDPDYTGKMIIVAEYSPRIYENIKISETYKETITNAKLVDDNEEFIVPEDFLQQMPHGAAINFYLIRANYNIGNFEDIKTYSIYTYNYKSALFTYP
jgi:hypothetical protein